LTGEEGLQKDHEIIALIAYLQRLGRDITQQDAAVTQNK
jgi:cbb3-type cytochrome oxidase cytochrome c subunit